MIDVMEEGDRLLMRGHGQSPFLHMTEPGDPGFVGFVFYANSRSDLEKIAAHDGVAIVPLDTPGGGEVVRLTDSDGFIVQIVFGQSPAPR